ncbi:MAG: hypothetical protein KGJ23_07905 [Euryarchaeota archaeon]|nr:hypothetical protein [Euryarchaeota archaeon]MDE1836524.1 hypothetical protein [Euryarchaeota archaeon]MDE1879281.1 hypothetical protein [Euryarchaeota archaeon]MDE2044494.1 hypothetical protein [Thermoplasmata archaeon]
MVTRGDLEAHWRTPGGKAGLARIKAEIDKLKASGAWEIMRQTQRAENILKDIETAQAAGYPVFVRGDPNDEQNFRHHACKAECAGMHRRRPPRGYRDNP